MFFFHGQWRGTWMAQAWAELGTSGAKTIGILLVLEPGNGNGNSTLCKCDLCDLLTMILIIRIFMIFHSIFFPWKEWEPLNFFHHQVKANIDDLALKGAPAVVRLAFLESLVVQEALGEGRRVQVMIISRGEKTQSGRWMGCKHGSYSLKMFIGSVKRLGYVGI